MRIARKMELYVDGEYFGECENVNVDVVVDAMNRGSIPAYSAGNNYKEKNMNTLFNPKIAELIKTLNSVNWNTLGMIK